MIEWTDWHEYHAGKIELIAGIDCWIWTGCAHPGGHGRVSSRSGHNYAHRAAYEAYTGSIDPDLMVRHLCGCAGCVRPSHLALGTAAENSKDMCEMQTSLSSLTVGQVRAIRRAYDRGERLADIADSFGIAFGSVYPIVCYKSHIHVDPEKAGKHRRRVTKFVTDEQIIEARRLIASGARNADIARRLGIAESAVSNIRTGKRYADRPDTDYIAATQDAVEMML